MTNNQFDVLAILKNGRTSLVEDILFHRRHDILRVAFKHENNTRVLLTIFDQYFIEYINHQLLSAFEKSTETGTLLVKLLSPALEERLRIRSDDLINVDKMLPDLFFEKIQSLKILIEINDITEAKLNQLHYSIERDNALFKRLLTKIEEDCDGRT